jgi:hypothetical protein
MKIMETTENQQGRRHWCRNPKHRAGWIILGVIGFTAFAFLFGAVVMWLWNALMPDIFHLGVITYWQAVGLAILGRLLFGGFHHGGHHHRGYHRFGQWRHRQSIGNERNCGSYANGMKWSYYDQYWTDEGEKAFDDYVERKKRSSEVAK